MPISVSKVGHLVLRVRDLDRALGNLIELYVDAPEQVWREDPTLAANSDPLAL
jgi:catechol-2,3-dioxygenase